VDFLNSGSKLSLEPVFVPSINRENIGAEYNLLIRKKDNYKSIKDLKGMAIGISTDQNHTASRLWLDVTLSKSSLPPRAKFFGKVVEIQKESQLLLNLFFGQIDACIVSDNALRLMKDLNPQIGENLISILTSPRYLQGILCFTKSFNDEKDRKIFRSGIMNVAQFPSGRQMLALIKISKLVPYNNEYMDTYRNLVKDYNNMKKMK